MIVKVFFIFHKIIKMKHCFLNVSCEKYIHSFQTNYMEKHIEVQNSRKLNDIWAFITYVVFAGIINTCLILNLSPPDKISMSLSTIYITQFLFKNIILVIILVIISMILLEYCPKIMIYGSLFILPITFIGIQIAFPKNIILSVISIILGLISFVIYFFIIHKNINYIASIISNTLHILSKYIVSFIMIFAILIMMTFSQGVLIIFADRSTPIVRALEWINILLIFWTFAVVNYFYQVFVASVIILHVINKDTRTSITTKALKNTIYALGSICFGALILAFIQTMKAVTFNLEDRNRRRQDGGSLITTIFLLTLHVIISLLETIVENTNRLTYPYLAIHGTSYKESVVQSFSIIRNNNAQGFASFIAVDLALALLTLGAFIISIAFNFVFLVDPKIEEFKKLGIVAVIINTFCFSGFLSMISSGSLAVVFIDIFAPIDLSSYDNNLYNTISAKQKELSNTNLNST